MGGSLNCSDAHLCVLVGVCWLSNVETSGGERWGDLIVGLGGGGGGGERCFIQSYEAEMVQHL